MNQIQQLPQDIQTTILSFVWPQCSKCLIYDEYNDRNKCRLCYIKYGYEIVRELHDKYKNMVDLKENLPDEIYDFIGEPEIITETCYLRPNSSHIYKIILNNENILSNTNWEDRNVTVFHSFAIRMDPENIKSIIYELGGLDVDVVYGNIFDVLYDIYDMPQVNKNGYTIIPLYLSKVGIEILKYSYMKIFITLNDNEKVVNIPFQYKKQYAVRHYNNYPLKRMLFYTPERYPIYEDKRIQPNISMLYFMVSGDESELELCINGVKLILKRTKQYNHVSLFSLVDNLTDHDHTLNLQLAYTTISKRYKYIYGIYRNVVQLDGGMANLLWSS